MILRIFPSSVNRSIIDNNFFKFISSETLLSGSNRSRVHSLTDSGKLSARRNPSLYLLRYLMAPLTNHDRVAS